MATPEELRELATSLASLAETLATQPAQPPAEPEPRQMPARVMFTVEEAAQQLGIGRTMMFRLIRSGEVESVRIGRLRRVPASAIQDYAARLVGNANYPQAA